MDEKNKKQTQNDKGDISALVKKYVEEAVTELKGTLGKDMEARIASEREEAAKLATMSSEERARAEIEKNRQSFETERAQYVSERAEFEAAKELTAQNLPVTFAKFVADSDKDAMLENITVLKTEYLKAIEAGLSERLRGTLPHVKKEVDGAADPFLSGLGM